MSMSAATEADLSQEPVEETPAVSEQVELEQPDKVSEAVEVEAAQTPDTEMPSSVVDFGSVLSQLEAAQEAEPSESDRAPAETEEGAAEADDRAWYVIHCYSGYENKVKHNLLQRIETMQMQDQIFQVEVPTEDEIEVREGKRRTVQRRIFPGYILVQMKMNDDSWYVVRNTPGVTGFVGMGNRPTPLRDEEVQNIMRRMEAEAPKIKVTFRPGQKVRIIDGPFNDFMGIVDEIDIDRAKVRVLVSFFGRETPVELDFLQVERM